LPIALALNAKTKNTKNKKFFIITIDRINLNLL